MSQRSTPMLRADPSERLKRPSTVPVPNVFSPTTLPRSASWIAPVTISAELAVLPSARTTIGILVARPPGWTGTSFSTPLRSTLWYTMPSPTNWLATPIASLT